MNRIFQQVLPNSCFRGNSGFKEKARWCKLPAWPVAAHLHNVCVASPSHRSVDELQWWQVWLCFCRSQLCCPASGLNLLQLSPVFAEPKAVTCCCLHLTFDNHLMPPVYLTSYSNWDRKSPQKTGNICPSPCVYNYMTLPCGRSTKMLLSKLKWNNF